MSEEVVPYEIEFILDDEDGALEALRALGPSGLGSIIHDGVPPERRDLAWWFEEWGWVLHGGIYGDFTVPEDDERFFTALAPHVREDSYIICGDVHGYRSSFFAWVFVGGRVERRDVDRRIEFDIARTV